VLGQADHAWGSKEVEVSNFLIGGEEYAISILKVKEIMTDIVVNSVSEAIDIKQADIASTQ